MPNNPIVVHVNADPATGKLLVIGNQAGNLIVIDKYLWGPQIIEWDLQLDGQKGAFNPFSNDPATSGFFWPNGAPSWMIFSRPELSDTRITIDDRHYAWWTEHEWGYQLRATVGSTPCETDPPHMINGRSGPWIKNR